MSVSEFTGQRCRALQITAKMPSDAMIQVMPVTTAEVVAWPTAAALVPHCIPRRQPVSATSTPKNPPLKTPSRNADKLDGCDGAVQIKRRRDIQHQGRNQEPAGDGDQVGKQAQERHHQDQRQHPGQDEELERRDAERLKRFNFLVHLHGAQLRGKGRAGAAADDDAGHDAGHLADRGHGHQIRRVDGRAELGQLGGADEGEDHSDEEVDQGHDAQSLRPASAG